MMRFLKTYYLYTRICFHSTAGVCLRQNVLSAVHLVFLVCFPLFQPTTPPDADAADRARDGQTPPPPPPPLYRTKFIRITSAAVLLTCACKILVHTLMPQFAENVVPCDDVDLALRTLLGYDDRRLELVIDVTLAIAFASVARFCRRRSSAAPDARRGPGPVRRADSTAATTTPDENCRGHSGRLCACLAALCATGTVVPSYACCVYYATFVATTMAAILGRLSDAVARRVFRATCLYTCVHAFALFAHQTEWFRRNAAAAAADDRLTEQFGLFAYYDLKCSPAKATPGLRGSHYFLPVMLIAQHYILWTYSNTICKYNTTSATRRSTNSGYIISNLFKWENMLLVGIKTVGFKVVILVWSISYPGWLTLTMLLWTTVFWMYLNSRSNLIVIQSLAVCMLFIEYAYIVGGNVLLKQVCGSDLKRSDEQGDIPTSILIKTAFTVTFWIALNQTNRKQLQELDDVVNSKLLSTHVKKYLSYVWVACLISTMLLYGFFGYCKINLIQIGYISLSLLFLTVFQISFIAWRRTIRLYWTIVILYSIVVVTVTYVFQFSGLAEVLATSFHISYDLQRDIGLKDTTSYLRIIVPAIISIAVLIHFQYLHEHFMPTLNADRRQSVASETVDDEHSEDTATEKGPWLSEMRDAAIRVFYVHLDKLEITLAVILVISKPCLFSGTLLVTMFLWTFFEHNAFMTRILFLQIVSYIIVTLAYQFTYFDYDNWKYEFQLSMTDRQIDVLEHHGNHTFRIDVAELWGMKIFDKNHLLFDFLKYELLILAVMVLKKTATTIMTFNYHPHGPPSSIFPNVKYADMNRGIPEFLMYLANDGFSLFGLEVTFVIVTIVIYLSPDLYASVYALWLMRFAVKNKTTAVSNLWPYFVTFVYLTVAFKYTLLIESTFNPNSDIPWKTVDLMRNTSVVLYDASYSGAWIKPLTPFDFILLVFASRQLTVFRKNGSRRTDSDRMLSDEEEFPDYMASTTNTGSSYLNILKRFVFGNSMLIILFVVFWISRHKMDLFSLGYLCAGTLFFWKGTYYFLMPRPTIFKFWNWLLEYCIMVMFIKVCLHLLGCLILNYFQWYSCILIRILSMFCPPQTLEKHADTCDTSEHDMALLGDVFTFTMVLFQRRIFNSGHFSRLIEDMEAVTKLTQKMYNLVNEWERRRKDESRKIDLESLEKVKIKLNKIRELKEQHVAKQLNHSQACMDGEYMFEEIYDDVFLVEKYDIDNFSKYDDVVSGPWLYRQCVCFVLYLTEKINGFSKEYQLIMQILNVEKEILKDERRLNITGLYKGSLHLLTSNNNSFHYNNMRYDVQVNKNKHYLIQFIRAVWNAILSSTHLLCYFAIFYNAMHNYCDEISMIPLLMVTIWGLLSVPRPSKTFWIVLITYMQMTGLVKYIWSFKEIPWLQEETRLQYLKTEDFFLYPTYQIGIGDYRNKIETDLMVLLILFIHRRTLIRLGLWVYNKDDAKNYTNKKQKTPLRMIVTNVKTYFTPIIEFYKNLRQYHTEGTVNVYPTMLLLVALQIPCSLLMDGTGKGLFALNRVSMNFLQTFTFHIITIVLDRWFYARRFVLGKLIFHLFFILVFLTQLQPRMKFYDFLNQLFEYNMYIYIVISSYQIRNGYLYRNASSFIWSRYTIFNLLAYKLYYYCPFVHETRTVLDWMWTDSSLAIMEWFKMDELFTHVCCIKCICNFRNAFDTPRGQKQSQALKLLIGGGIVIVISTVVIFPIAWFSIFEKAPDTPSSIEFAITFGEDSTVFSTKSNDINRLDSTDFKIMKELYMNSSTDDKTVYLEFLQQYEFDEISSINVIPQSINTWPITPYEFDKFKKNIFTSSSIKISVEWALTHHKGMEISHGKNIAIMDKDRHSELKTCLTILKHREKAKIPGRCNLLVMNNLLPKFLSLHLKSSEIEVIPELMVHNPAKPYMDMGLTFNYDATKFKYWWDMVEICPSGENSIYLRKMPYSSCADNDNQVTKNNTNIMYNIYIFSDKYSSTLQYLDDKGIVGLYTIIIVYIGYKLAFDIFRTFKFKLGYTETPYPDRILQLCYEIYLVRNFGEYEMEEDLYAMLIFLFRSPETLIRYTRKPYPLD